MSWSDGSDAGDHDACTVAGAFSTGTDRSVDVRNMFVGTGTLGSVVRERTAAGRLRRWLARPVEPSGTPS